MQLEVGEEATPFEHVPYDVNLQRCQRYCEVYDAESSLCTALAWSTANTSGVMMFRQRKRDIPSVIPSSTTAFKATNGGGATLASVNVGTFNKRLDSMELQVSIASGLTVGQATLLRAGAGTLTIDAEL